MESIISTFHIDWKIILSQAVNFGIVFAVLYFFALKPLSKMMMERSTKIEKGILDAKDNATLLAKTKDEYAVMLSKARSEAEKIFQEMKKEAENKKASMFEEAKKEVEVMLASGRNMLETEKTKMVEEAKKEIVGLAMVATEKLIKEKQEVGDIK